jgi:hypothetical protein
MSKRWVQLALGCGLVVVTVVVASAFVDEPLRAYVEQRMNRSLKGYTVRIGALDFHPIGFSVDLEDVELVRTDEPDPPMATIARWTARVHWKALLSGRVVNDQYMERPRFHITRRLARKEVGDERPVRDRGWQDAVESIYPFKINQVRIADAELTYIDEAKPERPLHFDHVEVYATNIRNVQSGDQTYPSELQLEGQVFDEGKLRVDGHADFLAEPYVAVKADILLENVPLGALVPVSARYNLQLSGGSMSAEGSVEYAPAKKLVSLKRLRIDGLHADYVHARQTQGAEEARARATVSTAQQVHANEDTLVRVEEITIVNSEFGFVNQAATPEYRVFLADAEAALQHYSNRLQEGAASVQLRGKFMGNGETSVTGILRPEHESPDFELRVKIAGTPIRAMNNLLRAHGKFDAVGGTFSCYSEVMLEDGRIRGYVKPLVRKLNVYDEAQDRHKNPLEKVREGAIEDLSTLLENVPRDEVATKVDMSGSAQRPRTEIVQIVIGLIQNAFFKAILPGFEQEYRSNDYEAEPAEFGKTDRQ